MDGDCGLILMPRTFDWFGVEFRYELHALIVDTTLGASSHGRSLGKSVALFGKHLKVGLWIQSRQTKCPRIRGLAPRNYGGLPTGSTVNLEYKVHERNVACRRSPHRSQPNVKAKAAFIRGLVWTSIAAAALLGIRIGS